MAQTQPNPAALLVGHALVGLAMTQLMTKKSGLTTGLGLTALGVVAHHLLDAPVARALSQVGV